MISYTLKCEDGHTFDSWFQSAQAFDKLLAQGMVTCSVCGALGVEKAVMAPRVRASRDSARWCGEAVKLLWKNRHTRIAEKERPEAHEAYQRAIAFYERIAREAKAD